MCRDRDLHVTKLFPGTLGGLGHDKGLLCCNRDFSALCRDRNSVSRQGLRLGQVWAMIRVSLCHDRVFPRVGHSYCDRNSKGGVVT